MAELRLDGCRSRPLGGYLKSLGLLRVVGRQVDAKARGRWRRDRFELACERDADGLATFLLSEYAPSPVVSPWNGGSGFFPKDRKVALEAIEASAVRRFANYRGTISAARGALVRRALHDKPSGDQKAALIADLRRSLPDAALEWLDAAIVLTGVDVGYPPLLGSGGNDGRFDFSNNYAGAVAALLVDESETARAHSEQLLAAALHGDSTPLQKGLSLAHFFRDASPVNSPTGESDSVGNPWDLILGLEGALVLCAGAARRHSSQFAARLVAPFTAQATAAGYASAIATERGRAELWLPMWSNWASPAEIELLAREARAQVGRRQARTGLDFARAAGELGVARGIDAFERYSILERAGQSSLAVPAGRIDVAPRPGVRAIRSVDDWLGPVMAFAHGDRCPRSVRDTAMACERALFVFAERSGAREACAALERLGALERALAASASSAIDAGLRPLAHAPAGPWLEAAGDGSPELALAAALASLDDPARGALALRDYLHGTRRDERGTRVFDPEARARVGGSETSSLLAALHARRHVDVARLDATGEALPFPRGIAADIAVLRAFALGHLDDRRVLRLLNGLCMLDFRGAVRPRTAAPVVACPALDVLALAWHGMPGTTLGPRRGWAARLAAGHPSTVLEKAHLRLRLAGLTPIAGAADLSAAAPPGRRLAAALLVRPSGQTLARIARSICLSTPTPAEAPKEVA